MSCFDSRLYSLGKEQSDRVTMEPDRAASMYLHLFFATFIPKIRMSDLADCCYAIYKVSLSHSHYFASFVASYSRWESRLIHLEAEWFLQLCGKQLQHVPILAVSPRVCSLRATIWPQAKLHMMSYKFQGYMCVVLGVDECVDNALVHVKGSRNLTFRYKAEWRKRFVETLSSRSAVVAVWTQKSHWSHWFEYKGLTWENAQAFCLPFLRDMYLWVQLKLAQVQESRLRGRTLATMDIQRP